MLSLKAHTSTEDELSLFIKLKRRQSQLERNIQQLANFLYYISVGGLRMTFLSLERTLILLVVMLGIR